MTSRTRGVSLRRQSDPFGCRTGASCERNMMRRGHQRGDLTAKGGESSYGPTPLLKPGRQGLRVASHRIPTPHPHLHASPPSPCFTPIPHPPSPSPSQSPSPSYPIPMPIPIPSPSNPTVYALTTFFNSWKGCADGQTSGRSADGCCHQTSSTAPPKRPPFSAAYSAPSSHIAPLPWREKRKRGASQGGGGRHNRTCDVTFGLACRHQTCMPPSDLQATTG